MGSLNYKSLAGNLSVAFLAQGISLCLSIVMSLLVPKVLGVEEFGYWQLFLLYASYTGFFHLGINDGVYLRYGGATREELNRKTIAAQLHVAAIIELLISVAIIAVALLGGFGEERSFVLVSVAAYAIIYNLSGYLGYVFQAVGETKLFSFSLMVDRLVFLVPLLILLVTNSTCFEPYVISYIVSKACAFVYCAWKGRDILFSKGLSPKTALSETWSSMCVGIKLMIANIASMLILGIMRFAIDAKWGIEVFGEISFSLTMTNFVLVFVSQASMVLFPELRRVDNSELAGLFRKMRGILGVSLPAVYLLYFPGVGLLSMWLPQYANSLHFFAYLLPVCVFDGQMSLMGTTFMKVLRRERQLLVINLAAVAVASVGVAAGVWLAGSPEFVVLCSTLVVALRSILSEQLLAREFCCSNWRIAAGELLVSVIFLASALFLSPLPAIMVYMGAYIFNIIFNSREIVPLVRNVLKIRKDKK